MLMISGLVLIVVDHEFYIKVNLLFLRYALVIKE